MDEWNVLADNICCEDPMQGGTTFCSLGDWHMSIYRHPGPQPPSPDTLIPTVLAHYGLEPASLQRQVLAQVVSLEQALGDCQITCLNLSDFVQQNQIGALHYYERLIHDGNTFISILNDGQHYYVVENECTTSSE